MKEVYKVIGLMSGTSLDGLDIAYCEFEQQQGTWSYTIPYATTIAYDAEMRSYLEKLPHASALDLFKAHNTFGDFCGKQVKQFVQQYGLNPDVVASHGQTIFHKPAEGYTVQIGNGANIHAQSGLPVVCDFRSLDVALGGQGAPLVPIGDKLLFAQYDMCLNLGGIANISFDTGGKRIAFDCCPANMVLNALTSKYNPELTYDDEGKIARSGTLNRSLFDKLEALEFYQQTFPKSLGKEWVDEFIFPLLAEFESLPVADLLHTFVHHIASRMSKITHEYLQQEKKQHATLLITGGGAFNQFLIELFQQYMGTSVSCVVPDKQTVMFKEALIFAFLGVKRLRGEANALASVTGAREDSIGGAVYGFYQK